MSDDCKTLSIPEAGARYFGLSRNGSYDAARRGEIPYIEIGRLKRVPVAAMEQMMVERVTKPNCSRRHTGTRA
jgi:hypothetical protein